MSDHNDVGSSANHNFHDGKTPADTNFGVNSYMDNWNFLMGSNTDLLYMDPNNVMQQIQYQQDITHLGPSPDPLNRDFNPNQHLTLNNNSRPVSKENSAHGTPNLTVSHSSQSIATLVNKAASSMNNNAPNTTSQPSGFSPDSTQKSTKPRRPCDNCRRRKTKCVIAPGSNNCTQCESKSLTCTYTSQATKRKHPDEPELPNKRTNYDIVPPNVPIRDVAPVEDYLSMNHSLLKKTLSLQFPRSSFFVGPTSHLYDVNLLNMIIDAKNNNMNVSSVTSSQSNASIPKKIEQIDLSDTISLRKVSNKVHFILKEDQLPLSYQAMSNDVDKIEKFIAPHGQILIDLYFRIIHPSYPILHKKVFLEKYSRTHREFSAPLLAAVYVLAIQWWEYDPQLNRFPKPDVELILKIGLNNYLLEIMKRPKLSAVQAGLLLLQCKHIVATDLQKSNNNSDSNNDNDSKSAPTSSQFTGIESEYSDWVLCSQVVALSEELGLGLDCNSWKLPKWERGLRKRLAWAVYMEDKWLSLKNARPSHINDVNWIVAPLVEEDFPEKHGDGDLKEGSSDIENGKKIFINNVELSKILSDILVQCYSYRAMNEITAVEQALEIAKPIQFRLRNWYRSLPQELQMKSVQTRKLCSNGYLHLAYFATELTLHRKLFTMIYQQNLAGNPPPKVLFDACRQAARTRLLASIEFVRDLKPEHIHSFWHSSSAANFTLIGTFAAILFMSSPTKEDSDFYRDQIFNYRWILKISSKGFEQVGEALNLLDMIFNRIPGLFSDNVELPMVVPNVDQTLNYGQNSQIMLSSYNSGKPPQNQLLRKTSLQSRNHQDGSNDGSAYNSPQTMSTSNIHQAQSPNNLIVSRTGTNYGNSPQSTQSLSPKEMIKHPRIMNQQPNISPDRNNIVRKASTNSTGSGVDDQRQT